MSKTDFLKTDMHGEFTRDFNQRYKSGEKSLGEAGLVLVCVTALEISKNHPAVLEEMLPLASCAHPAAAYFHSSTGVVWKWSLTAKKKKKRDFPFDSASPFMGRLPLNDSLYTINGIIHDFVIKNEKFLFLVLGMCFEIIHNGPSMF